MAKEYILTPESGYWYRLSEEYVVKFKESTLGRYKGTFMLRYRITEGENGVNHYDAAGVYKVEEMKRSHMQGSIIIPECVVIDEKPYTYQEVFRDMARPGRFCIEESRVFEGWTFNEYWNGFSCPYFRKDVSLEICRDLSWKEDNETYCTFYYDEKTDSFYCRDVNSDFKDELIANPCMINTENGEIHVYNWGGSLIWSEE